MRWNRWFLLATAAGIALLVGFGSRSDAAPGGKSGQVQTAPLVRIAWQNGFSSLDPYRQQLGASGIALKLMLESLVRVNGTGKIEMWLARSMKVEASGLRYVFELRRNVRFWNGNELTAADVANAINYYRAPGSVQRAGFAIIRSVEAKGRYTVVIKIKRRDAGFLASFAFNHGIFEKKFQQEHGDEMGRPGVLTMGTGPWRPTSLNPTQSLELAAHPNYWRGRVPIQRLSLKFIEDPTAQFLAFKAGDVDIVFGVGDRQGFEATTGTRVYTYRNTAITYMGLNTQRGPWSDVHVRRATLYAANKNQLLAAQGGARDVADVQTIIAREALEALAPKKQVDQLLRSLPQYPFNLAKARAEMRQSKYPNGFTAELSLIPFARWPEMTQVLAANLAKIGIRLQLKNVPFGEWATQVSGFPKQQIFLSAAGPSLDASTYPSFLLPSEGAKEGGGNLAEYKNPRVDALLSAGLKTTDRETRFKIYSELLRIVARDAPYLIINTSNFHAGVSSQFTWRPNIGRDSYPWALDIRPK